MFKMGPQSGITSGSVRGESVFLPFPVFSGHLQTLTCGPFLCLQSQHQGSRSSPWHLSDCGSPFPSH